MEKNKPGISKVLVMVALGILTATWLADVVLGLTGGETILWEMFEGADVLTLVVVGTVWAAALAVDIFFFVHLALGQSAQNGNAHS